MPSEPRTKGPPTSAPEVCGPVGHLVEPLEPVREASTCAREPTDAPGRGATAAPRGLFRPPWPEAREGTCCSSGLAGYGSGPLLGDPAAPPAAPTHQAKR